MRVRGQDADGDYTFGRSAANFLVNSSDAVGQLVGDRLRLVQGEWFLDQTAGTPWNTEILAEHTVPTYDAALRAVILDTLGVVGISSYDSSLSPERDLTVTAEVVTQFGTVVVNPTL